MFDGGPVCGSVIGLQTHEIVMEDDIDDPLQPVFDVPVGVTAVAKRVAESSAT